MPHSQSGTLLNGRKQTVCAARGSLFLASSKMDIKALTGWA